MTNTRTLIMDVFPDFNEPGFDIDRYNQRFYNSNVIIRASANKIDYPTHWSPLSVKCSFHGQEHYETRQSRYAVDDGHFLVFNNGKNYSSWIDSPTCVDSVTLNIAPAFEQLALRSIKTSTDHLLDDPFDEQPGEFRFTERLYCHGPLVSPIVKQMATTSDKNIADRLFYLLMEDLFALQDSTNKEIARVDRVRPATRKEIYERLLRARDYIHSCYREDMLLEEIAAVACMNTFYFLRQFRKAFNVTPHQFLVNRRMEVANRLLRITDRSITEVCYEVGVSDLSSFGKLFRRRYGVSPTGLRTYVKS